MRFETFTNCLVKVSLYLLQLDITEMRQLANYGEILLTQAGIFGPFP